MEWQEITVTVTGEATEAVAGIFYEVDARGVMIQDPRDIAKYVDNNLWDYHSIPPEILESTHVLIRGYLLRDAHLTSQKERLYQGLEHVRKFFPQEILQIDEAVVDDEGWATSWKAYYRPEKVGDKIVVVPSWEEYQPAPEEITILLDPGMAFGTGNHPTTAMCIRALERFLQPGQSVIDAGTGSGILTVVAAKLAAKEILAVDIDPLAVKVARENIILNGVEDQVQLAAGDFKTMEITLNPHLVVANIVADVIIGIAHRVFNLLRPGGKFICGGIIRDRRVEVREVLFREGFKLEQTTEQGEWVTIAVGKE
ncbi:MAG: 50S ribosomal protein L11 methyltransferase [Bacillota bacterium]